VDQPTQAKDRSSPKSGSTSETKPLGSLEKFLKGPNKKPLKKETGEQLASTQATKGTLKTRDERKAIRSPRSRGSVDSEGMRATKPNVRRKTSDRASLPRTGSKNSLASRPDNPTLPPRRAKARPKPIASHIETGEALQGQGMRIQKWLSMQGVASRREAEEWINERKVFVNGKLVLEQGLRIDPMVDKVTVLGRHISDVPPPRVYWMLNKPDMVLTSRPDGTGRLSIYDLHSTKDLQFLVSPVGRLDFRTEGLLLLSNDGELVHRLAHPKYKVPRYYNVLIDGRLNHEEEAFIRRGIELEDGPTGKTELLFAHSVNLGQSRGSWYFITVYEGRNRLVRRLFEYFGFKVVRLVRYGFGDLRLPDDLLAGEYRQLTPSEIKYLKETVHLSGE
jgi:pseudouridine synthase